MSIVRLFFRLCGAAILHVIRMGRDRAEKLFKKEVAENFCAVCGERADFILYTVPHQDAPLKERERHEVLAVCGAHHPNADELGKRRETERFLAKHHRKWIAVQIIRRSI